MSSENVTYVLDTNIFIQAKNEYYAFDICPGFWAALKGQIATGAAVSVDRVFDELKAGYDQLSEWVKAIQDGFFRPTADQKVIRQYAKVVAWAQAQAHFTPSAQATFADAKNADAWVVAYAKAYSCVVITHEKFEPAMKKAVKIPNACAAFDVPCMNTFDMLRSLKTKFILPTKKY